MNLLADFGKSNSASVPARAVAPTRERGRAASAAAPLTHSKKRNFLPSGV